MKKPILVVKFGSASITTQNGEVDERIVLEIARQIAVLQKTYNIVLVSSGAVAAGRKFLPSFSGTLSDRKAAAAIGNPILIRTYSTYFRPYQLALAQSLCERQHFANRDQFLQLKNTYETLWKNNVIPIANENDVVSNKELKFSDNDELATLIAIGFGAEKLLFSTSVQGVLDGEDKIIPEIKKIDRTVLGLARTDKTAVGLGGMTSKLNFARLANQMGIEVVIFSMQTDNAIIKALSKETGTYCHPEQKKVSSRKKWLASGSIIKGEIMVDKGAEEALLKGKSLLAVGVSRVVEHFEKGEVLNIVNLEGLTIAVARAKTDSILLNERKKKNMEIAHANDIVIL